MRVLGIDPGFAILGWGVVDAVGSTVKHVNHGVILTTPDMRFQDRLVKIKNDLQDILTLYKPDEIAFEELFFARNVTTALTVGAARGCVVTVAAEYTDKLYEYTPMEVKQAIVGYGRAEKFQIQQMVKMLLNLKDIPKPDDAADALALAITHANAGYAREHFRMK